MEPISAGIMAGGSLLSGLLSRKKGVNPETQIAFNLDAERQSFNQKMALAKQHGLHPLTVLGSPMATTAPMYEQSSPGDFSGLGYNASNLAQSMVNPDGEGPKTAQQAVNDPREDRRKSLILDGLELDNQRKTQQIQHAQSEFDQHQMDRLINGVFGFGRAGAAGSPPAGASSNDVNFARRQVATQSGIGLGLVSSDGGVSLKQEIMPPHPSKIGYAAAADQGWSRVMDRSGHMVSVPNPNIFQPELEKYGSFYTLADKFGIHRAMQIMAGLENVGLVGGLGLGAAGIYKYHQSQKESAAEKQRQEKSRIRSTIRGFPQRNNYRQPF